MHGLTSERALCVLNRTFHPSIGQQLLCSEACVTTNGFHDHEPSLMPLYHKEDIPAYCNIMWKPMLVDQTLILVNRKGKLIPRIYTHTYQNLCSFPGRRSPMWSTCCQGAGWSHRKIGKYHGTSVDLCCWQVRHPMSLGKSCRVCA